MAATPSVPRLPALLPALLLGLLVTAPRAEEVDNGVFRFLTQDLPVGSTNTEYIGQLIVVNADGPVTFTADVLPSGMSLDPVTGILRGRPESTFNQTVTFTADDGVAPVQLAVGLTVSASGGGGNDGSTVTNVSLADGRVGDPYVETISVTNGIGPYLFGAVSLPAGLSLDGQTGEISGEPLAAGRFLVRFTIIDQGEDNKVVTILPLTVLPADNDFAWVTGALNNGELGTPFCDTWTTTGTAGKAKYTASGLPSGLSVDQKTGVVTGTPQEAGTYRVLLTATDGKGSISSNLTMVVAPSPSSSFYWADFGIPTALAGLAYERVPPVLLATENGGDVTYSAVGLPDGIDYDPNTGELSGTAADIGEYTATFTASDADSGEVLELSVDFLVLPPTGGDANSLPVNVWVRRQKARTGTAGKDRWIGSAVYNADRTAGNAFDPATEAVRLELGSRVVEVAPGAFLPTKKQLVSKTDKGVTPREVVRISPRKQLLSWKVTKDAIADKTPGTLRHVTTVGDRGYRLDAFFDGKGTFKPYPGLRRAAFVVEKAVVERAGGGQDRAKLLFRLGDPAFVFDPDSGDDTLALRVLVDGAVVLDRDFSSLGLVKTKVPKKTGITVYKVRTTEDEALTDRVRRFTYNSRSGRAKLVLEDVDLSALPVDEEHVSVELTVGARTYYTGVTLFGDGPDRLTTLAP